MSILLPITEAAVGEGVLGGPLDAATALRVGDLARRTGKTVRALHLYEELGLLDPVDRSRAGYRQYGLESVTRVRWIAKLQDIGFSLTDIREIVREWAASGSAPTAMQRVTDLYSAKLAETREHIVKLKALEAELEASLDYLQACGGCAPQTVLTACSICGQRGCDEQQPDLIAGLHIPSGGAGREARG